MENLRRLLPAAAQNGVAEAEVASARHIFDFEAGRTDSRFGSALLTVSKLSKRHAPKQIM